MTCNELIDTLVDYIGGELAAEQRASADAHLAGCQNCTFYLESYTHTVRVVRQLPKCGPLPPAFEARLRQVLKEHFCDEKG